MCETTGLSRKHVINILNGKIVYREHKGRGKAYRGEVVDTLKKIWYEAGCPCAPYLKCEIARWTNEYSTQVANVREDVRERLLKMSASTMSRNLKGEVRVKPGWSKANKRSGRSAANEIKAAMPCASGETIRACDVPLGDCQVDTFALGGGSQADNFFWILDAVERKTQWTELAPTWNRGQHATCEALKHNEERMPFTIRSLHSDNGGEILNHHVMAYLGQKPQKTFVWRSRPRKSNDNAHVEEKNRSSGRQLFGEIRLDCPDLKKELFEICEAWSDYKNFFIPCKMLVSKEKREDGKGYRCRYDKPKTPFQRVLDEKALTPEQTAALEARRASMTGMGLYHRVIKKLKRIKRIQAEYTRAKSKTCEGTGSATETEPTSVPKYVPHANSAEYSDDRRKSAAFLASMEVPDYMRGIETIKRAMKRVKTRQAAS